MADQPIRVLLVEDNPTDVLLLQEALAQVMFPQFELINVERLDEGLERLRQAYFDIILLDLSLPDSQGLETLVRMRDHVPHVPIVVLTGLTDEELGLRALQKGAQDYLTKGQVEGRGLARAIRYAIERERSEKALRESEVFNRAVINSLTGHMVVLDREGNITAINLAWERYARANGDPTFAHTGVGKNYLDVCRNASGEYVLEAAQSLAGIEAVLNGSLAEFSLEYPCHSPTKEFWFALHVTALPTERGGVVIMHRNITGRKQAEAELAQRAAQLALINEISSQIAAMLELDGVLDRAAHLVQERFGYHHVALFLVEEDTARLKAIAGSYKDYFPANHSQGLGQGIIGWVGRHGERMVVNDVSAEPHYVSLLAGPTVTQSELCLPVKVANRVVGILDIQSPVLNAFGENDVMAMEALTHQLATAVENARLFETVQAELADRKRAETEIRQRNRELSLLNQIITTSTIELESETMLEFVCQELTLTFQTSGATATLFNEDKTTAVIVAEYRTKGQPSMLGMSLPIAGNVPLQHILMVEGPFVVEDAQHDPRLTALYDLLHENGIISLLVLPLRSGGEVIGSLSLETVELRTFSAAEVSLAWNVADQVAGALTRARLTQTQQRLSAAIEQANDTVIITDTTGTIIYVNPAFERNSGYRQAKVIGQTPRILKSDQHDTAFFQELWATISAGEVWRGRFVNKKKDGSLYTEDATITPVRNESGIIVNYVSVQHDVTHELQLEEQYRQAQKMEAIGRLSGGIAHDFNNLLVVINGYSEMLLMDHHQGNQKLLQNYTEEIIQAGERAAGLTRQLLAFSRQQVLQPQILNLNELVVNLEKMLRRLIGEDINMVAIPGNNLGRVKADPGQIEQVILNLVVNARDAMPQGGKLTIETTNIDLDEVYTHERLDAAPGCYVMLSVSDSGIGMDAEVRSHIFEPFFTTKEQGKGTGLGLATVYGIIKQSGGDIQVYSEPGQGTTFKIYLPCVDKAVEVAEPHPASPDLPSGSETVLVVEDESSVRTLARHALEFSGYTVLEAGHGQEALSLCQQQLRPIHLLVTDIVMPGGMNGRELAERLKAQHPVLKVLFMSGYTDEAIVQHGVLEQGLFFLQKPFTPYLLIHKVREVLDTPLSE